MLICFVIGVVPAALYNLWNFGSPFVPANVAGNFTDTFPRADWPMIVDHLNAYFGSGGIALWRYMPVAVLGTLGLFAGRFDGRARQTAVFLLALHIAYLVCIPTLGTCQFGPRYLLPVLPLFAFGVALLAEQFRSRLVMISVAAAMCLGFAINSVGAIAGSMFCDLSVWSFPPRLAFLQEHFEPSWMPLRYVVLFAAAALLLIYWLVHRSEKSGAAET